MKNFDSRNEDIALLRKKLKINEPVRTGGKRKVPLIWDLRVPLLRVTKLEFL